MHKGKPGTTIGVNLTYRKSLSLSYLYTSSVNNALCFPYLLWFFKSILVLVLENVLLKTTPPPTTLPRKIYVLYACFTFWGLFAIHSLKQNTQNLLEMMKWWWCMMKSNKVDYITLTFHLFFLIYSFPHILWNYLISIMI